MLRCRRVASLSRCCCGGGCSRRGDGGRAARAVAVAAHWPCRLRGDDYRDSGDSRRRRTRPRRASWQDVTRTRPSPSRTSPSPSRTHAQLTAFLSLSDRLFAHEAAAAALPPLLAHDEGDGDGDDEGDVGAATTEAVMQLYLDPLASQQQQHDDDGKGSGSRHGDVAVTSSSDVTTHAGDALARIGDVSVDVEASVRALLTMTSSDANANAAAALLLRGLDVKAVLASGTLSQLRLRRTRLVQCDVSYTRWRDVYAEECCFAMSVWYGVSLHDVTFVRCDFDACVLKKLQCSGRVRFVQCTLRRAAIGVIAAAATTTATTAHAVGDGDEGSATSAATVTSVVFDRCDVDLASFEGCRAPRGVLRFTACRNIATAADFPTYM